MRNLNQTGNLTGSSYGAVTAATAASSSLHPPPQPQPSVVERAGAAAASQTGQADEQVQCGRVGPMLTRFDV